MLLPDLFHDDFRQRSYHDWYDVLVNLLKKTAGSLQKRTATRKQKIVKSNKNKDGA
ncbi:hypothetical protein IIA28_11545 [candidate division KSB1 bacterium]|nr:hypothetical protein [candidate division KSB1 bacterium]MCH8955935.1 hypothetical protein [candidate division KSB1 bacterium]